MKVAIDFDSDENSIVIGLKKRQERCHRILLFIVYTKMIQPGQYNSPKYQYVFIPTIKSLCSVRETFMHPQSYILLHTPFQCKLAALYISDIQQAISIWLCTLTQFTHAGHQVKLSPGYLKLRKEVVLMKSNYRF